MVFRKRWLIVIVPVAAVLLYWYWSQRPMFPHLQGPLTATELPKPDQFRLDMHAFPRHGNSALALLVNDAAASWYGLADAMRSMGIPFVITTDANEAFRHKVVMVYPMVTGTNTTPEVLQTMMTHVRSGGTLLAFSVLGGGLQDLFGFDRAEEDNVHHRVDFAAIELLRDIVTTPVEAQVYLGEIKDAHSGAPSVSYRNPLHTPVATYEDGSAAITQNTIASASGVGHAYALGVDWGHFILQAHAGRAPERAETYDNGYQPKLDTLLRFIAAVYRQGERDAVLLSPTPGGKDVTVLMTHDIDFTRSIVNAPDYAQVEHEAGVPATYFIQTKYVKDYSDDPFFEPGTIRYLQQLTQLGMEIGSHTVAHSRILDTLEAGTGTEQYPQYHPFVKDLRQIEGATILGELRVSKFLLESQTGDQVISFRPGHLAFPSSLPQLLKATGFLYSSSMTANEALTHLPFRDMVDRSYGVPSPTYEFPVTIEDEEGRLGDRVDVAIDVSRNIARYHGLVTVLVHTDSVDHKLDFTRKYIAAMKDSAWFSTVRDYGKWWAARENVTITVEAPTPASRKIALIAKDAIDDLTLLVPASWHYQGSDALAQQQGERLTVKHLGSGAELELMMELR